MYVYTTLNVKDPHYKVRNVEHEIYLAFAKHELREVGLSDDKIAEIYDIADSIQDDLLDKLWDLLDEYAGVYPNRDWIGNFIETSNFKFRIYDDGSVGLD